jgi:transposase
MAKRHYQLTPAEVNALLGAYTHSQDGPTRTRYQAVRLYGTGYPVDQIKDITGCSRTSLMEWCQAYRAHGVSGLLDKRSGGNNAKLTSAQIDELGTHMHTYTPRQVLGEATATQDGLFWTVEDLQRALHHWYQVEYRSRSSLLALLDTCGFSYQRPSQVFKSRRATEGRAFEEQFEKS